MKYDLRSMPVIPGLYVRWMKCCDQCLCYLDSKLDGWSVVINGF